MAERFMHPARGRDYGGSNPPTCPNRTHMNIGFYGHSAASWAGEHNGVRSYIETVLEHYDANLVNLGVPQGSEERILFDLKKTKKLDVAVIFHSYPRYLYMPKCKRDIDINKIKAKRFDYLWDDKQIDEHMDNFFVYGGIKESFGEDKQLFIETLTNYKQFLHHKDLAENRFAGALVQIDQYLSFKKIPVVHACARNTIPPWFKFTSGYNAVALVDLLNTIHEQGTFPNNISASGQEMMHSVLIRLIDRQMVDNA